MPLPSRLFGTIVGLSISAALVLAALALLAWSAVILIEGARALIRVLS